MGCAMSVGLSADMANKAFPAEGKDELKEQLVLDTFFKNSWVPMSPSTPRSPMVSPHAVSPHMVKPLQLE
jgi:hypothetical protein